MQLRIDELKKLQHKKYRSHYGCFLAEGEHLVLELEKAAAHNRALLDSHLYVTESFSNWPGPLQRTVISDRQMTAIADTASPQGIAALVPLAALTCGQQEDRAKQTGERAIYLHEIQDPGNLGTILRTLAWFGGFRCLLSPGSVDPFNSKVVRASMGAVFHVTLELEVPVEALEARFPVMACLDLRGEAISEPSFREADCYLFGNEARGLPEPLPDSVGRFAIAGCGVLESLNLAAAVNMCVYELMRPQ